MELTAFRQQASAVKKGISPYKIIRLDELNRVEEDVYSMGGVDVRLTPRAQLSLDSAIGTTEKQLKIVKGCSGNQGQANFHNYLSVASNIFQEKQIVLIADKESRTVTDVIVPKEEFIPVEAFFDFTEMFVDYTHTEVEKMERSLEGDMDIHVYLQPSNPKVVSLGKGEDFIPDAMYLRWNGTSIELGNYFIRLVCTNGQTMRIDRKEAVIYSMKQEGVGKLLELASSGEIMGKGFLQFREKALEAMGTAVSLRELRTAYSELKGPGIGLPMQVAASIAPYQACKTHFNRRGISVAGREKRVKTDLTWWRFYNNLTNFATHTDCLAPDDNTRGRIIRMAMRRICDIHDIKTYVEYE